MLKKLLFLTLIICTLSWLLISCDDSDADKNKNPESSVNDDNGAGGNESDAQEPSTDEENEQKDPENSDGNNDGNEENTQPEVKYVYSFNSKKYHLPTCYHVNAMKPETKIEFSGTIEELADFGYLPCKSCKPDPNFDYEGTDDTDDTDDGEVSEFKYVVNTVSEKFHLYGCASAENMNEENKQYTNETKEELLQKGYTPCAKCHP